MDWKIELGEASRMLATYRKADPGGAAGFTAMHTAAMGDGHLDTKQKELICLAIGIVRQCVDCIGFHTKAAKAAGATREEITEVITVTVYMGGGPAYMYGVKALDAYDQL